jgi:Uma2 family endonuclease
MAVRRGVRYAADYIWESPDDDNRYEVIDGELFGSPPPVWEHQFSSGKLFLHVGQHVYRFGLGKVVSAPVGVVLDEGAGLQPDLVYVSKERADIITARGIEGVPDLVVEILSPSTRARDLGAKLERFARAGVPHYWIADPRTRTLEARELVRGSYEVTGIYGPGDIFRPALFPGLEIPIDHLWE